MEKGYLDVVINEEELINDESISVSHCTSLGITSQGKTIDEVIKNIREIIEIYLEEQPEKYEELLMETPSFSIIRIEKNAKASNFVR